MRRRSYAPARRRRGRRSSSGTGFKLWHGIAAAAALGWATDEDNKTVEPAISMLKKIPGTKTIGVPAMAGIVCLGVNRYVWRNRWLKLAGIAGVIYGAFNWGKTGFALKWVGDADDGMIADVG